MDDPAAAGHFNRAVEDLAVTRLHALRRRVNVADVEVVKPEGVRLRRRLGEHGTDRLPTGRERLIRAPRAGFRRCFLPAKKRAVESPRLLTVGGVQLLPADGSRRARLGVLPFAGYQPL